MDALQKILKFEWYDQIRNKWIVLYTAFFFVLTFGLFQLQGDASRVFLTMTQILLLIVPLVSMIFGAMHVYHSREFIEILLCQPIRRSKLFWGVYLGMALPLAGGFVVGAGVPILMFGYNSIPDWRIPVMLLGTGLLLTMIFSALAFGIAMRTDDKLKGIGFALGLWFALALLFDGMVLYIVYAFADYPLEKPLIGISMLNPINIARSMILMKMDVAAMMGYTGAAFKKFFGGSLGVIVSLAALVGWAVLPLFVAQRHFLKKDF